MNSINVLFIGHFAPPRHCAGAEMMVLSMLRPLVLAGHDVRWQLTRPTPDEAPYDLHGVTVYPQTDHDGIVDQIEWSDVVITHLENMPLTTTLARAFDRPFIHVMHNDHELSQAWCVTDAAMIVLNSQWMADSFGNPNNGHILRPPVFGADYQTKPGSKVTLINLNENKGGLQFAEIAARMPDVDFLGVIGAYQDQIVPDLPNVEIREHGGDMRAVYGSTRILLMPSEYESWGRVGVEAMHSGIPVIAHPTDGLIESLGPAGVFVDRENVDAWEREIRRLLRPAEWRQASAAAKRRAAELDPTNDLAEWANRITDIATRARDTRLRRQGLHAAANALLN